MLLEALKGAPRFVGLMKPWRQGPRHYGFAAEFLLAAALVKKKVDIEEATRNRSVRCWWTWL
jgi:hypothetical protein